MERATKVSNIHGEAHFKQKQRLTIVFTRNTLPHRKRSRNDNKLKKIVSQKLKYVWKHLSTETHFL